MKRIAIIAAVFLIIMVLLSTSCTCKLGDETSCRGLGYVCIDTSIRMCDCMLVEHSGTDSITPYDLATEGEYYSKPEIIFTQDGQYAEVEVYMDIYKQFSLDMEICFVQDGVLLDKYKYSGTCKPEQGFKVYDSLFFEEYNSDRGEVYYFINRFEASVRG